MYQFTDLYIRVPSLTLARDLRHFIELDKNNLDIEEYDNAKRQRPGRKSGDAASTYRDLT